MDRSQSQTHSIVHEREVLLETGSDNGTLNTTKGLYLIYKALSLARA